MRDLVALLTAILLGVHLLEIAGRRLLLFPAAGDWLRTLAIPRPGLGWLRRRAAAGPKPAAKTDVPGAEPGPAPLSTPPTPATSALARAKAKARGRLER
jgi:hypothetical protein